MIHVNRSKVPFPDVFNSREIEIAKIRLVDFYNRSKDSRSQERFSVPFRPEIRTRILPFLIEAFNGKCAYCESRIPLEISNPVMDNFRPKAGARGLESEFSKDHYWWLSYEWNNLYYSCLKCNNYKSSWFPVEGQRCEIEANYNDIIVQEFSLLVDPCIDQPDEHLFFKERV